MHTIDRFYQDWTKIVYGDLIEVHHCLKQCKGHNLSPQAQIVTQGSKASLDACSLG